MCALVHSLFQNLAQVVSQVQALRINQKSNDKIIREKVSETTRLIRDVHKSLAFLGKKSSDADQAIAMFTHCQEKFQNLIPLKNTARLHPETISTKKPNRKFSKRGWG